MSTGPTGGEHRQRALVTGATSGLGRAIARQLARDGFEVIVHGRDPGRGAQAVAEIEQAGGTAVFAAADISDAAGIQQLASAAGDVDVLVNNAGFSWFGATADLTPDTFDGLFASNVRAPYFLVAAIAPGWRPAAPAASSTSAAWLAGSGSLPGASTARRKARLNR